MDQLEPELRPVYQQWRERPGPETTGQLIRSLSPTIDKGLRTFGGGNDPVLRGRAKRLALSALESYDPRQGKLQSHIMSHLQGLRRYARKQLNVLGTPERQLLEYRRLQETEADLEDELGRKVTDAELADRLGWSMKRIQRLRNIQTGIPAGQIEETGGEHWVPGVSKSNQNSWIDLIYPDMTVQQQLILDHTLGLHGRRKLANRDLAKLLRVTPGYISQQKARIQSLLDQEQFLSPF